MSVESNSNEDDEAAYVDAFFLPGGILDPEEERVNAYSSESPLLFGSTSEPWLKSGDCEKDPLESKSWFGQRLLVPSNKTEFELSKSLVEDDAAVVKPTLQSHASGQKEETMKNGIPSLPSITDVAKEKGQANYLSNSPPRLEVKPDWKALSLRELAMPSQNKPCPTTLAPPPPPGFENSPLTSKTLVSPPKMKALQQNKASANNDSVLGGPPLEITVPSGAKPRPPTVFEPWGEKTIKRVGALSAKQTPDPLANDHVKTQPLEDSASYRAAVISTPPQLKSIKTHQPERSKKKKVLQNQGSTNATNQKGNPRKNSDSKPLSAPMNGTNNGWMAPSSNDPSNWSGEDDGDYPVAPIAIVGGEDFHPEESRDGSEWNEIGRSSNGKSRREFPRKDGTSTSALPKEAFWPLDDDSAAKSSTAVEAEEGPAKVKDGSLTNAKMVTKNKNNSRRQQQGKTANVPVLVPTAKTDELSDDLDSVMTVLVSGFMYLYEAIMNVGEIFRRIIVFFSGSLFPTLRQSLWMLGSWTIHSLKGILLLVLAAFHAYSFAADETLAQINFESSWIPYVSLIYAPTATRHVMNYVDLPHFTPHLVSSAVLCFLFRRPGGTSNVKRNTGKPTTEDLRNFVLRCCQLLIPVDLVMDGFSSVNTSIMTLSYTDRLLLAYVICAVRKGWMLVPCAWLSFAAQCLVAVYFPWKHILAEPVLLFILFSIGMASLNVLRILEHWKQRAKKAIGKNA